MAKYMALQIQAIMEAFQKAHTTISLDQFAIDWIKENAEKFSYEHKELLING